MILRSRKRVTYRSLIFKLSVDRAFSTSSLDQISIRVIAHRARLSCVFAKLRLAAFKEIGSADSHAKENALRHEHRVIDCTMYVLDTLWSLFAEDVIAWLTIARKITLDFLERLRKGEISCLSVDLTMRS